MMDGQMDRDRDVQLLCGRGIIIQSVHFNTNILLATKQLTC